MRMIVKFLKIYQHKHTLVLDWDDSTTFSIEDKIDIKNLLKMKYSNHDQSLKEFVRPPVMPKTFTGIKGLGQILTYLIELRIYKEYSG
jgi:hypothetical protein